MSIIQVGRFVNFGDRNIQGSLADVIGGYTQPVGERKHFGALLVGDYGDGKLKFTGRVGTGFSEKLLKSLSDELTGIAVKTCPFFNLPAPGRGHLDPGLSAAENEAVPLGRAGPGLPGQIHGMDAR